MSPKLERALINFRVDAKKAGVPTDNALDLVQILRERADKEKAEERLVAARKADIKAQFAKFDDEHPDFDGTDADIAAALNVKTVEVHYVRYVRSIRYHRRLRLIGKKAAE